ncbi:MAG: hypothetical protein HOV79_28915 [Hamadaea sp.]|nr:hypothetical protein [Hamadaea sp.]
MRHEFAEYAQVWLLLVAVAGGLVAAARWQASRHPDTTRWCVTSATILRRDAASVHDPQERLTVRFHTAGGRRCVVRIAAPPSLPPHASTVPVRYDPRRPHRTVIAETAPMTA